MDAERAHWGEVTFRRVVDVNLGGLLEPNGFWGEQL